MMNDTNERVVVGIATVFKTQRRSLTSNRHVTIRKRLGWRWVSGVSWGDGDRIVNVRLTEDRSKAYEFTVKSLAWRVAKAWAGVSVVTR